ncbi:unnamed protein product [Auanema sp. JU1783]|nr:unnamed protein product [Auanema sp. JU1783]
MSMDCSSDPWGCSLRQLYEMTDPVNLPDTTFYVVYSINLVLILLFWICFFFRIRRDYASYYLFSIFLPYTIALIGVIARKILVGISFNTMSAPQLIPRIVEIEMIFSNTARHVFPLTTMLFMFFTVYVACCRQHIYPSIAFILNELIVGLVLATIALYQFIPSQLWRDVIQWINYLPLVATIGTIILLLLLLLTFVFTCCCCKADHHENPVVYNYKRRLFWTFIFIIFIYVVHHAILILSYHSRPFPEVPFTLEGIRPYLIAVPFTFNLLPIYVLIPAFLLLPTFRTALFCISNNNRTSVLPTTSSPKA